MNKTRILITGVLLLASLCMLAQKDLSDLNQTINEGKAENIKALIHISGGELTIKGGSKELANINLTFDKEDWDPSVGYVEQDNVGKLTVSARTTGEEKRIDDDNECNIILNSKKNYSLGLVLGAGVADINLANFDIKKALFKLGVGSFNVNLSNTSVPLLKVDAGIGEAVFDLSGGWKNDLTAIINAGIGEIKIIVPKDVGVKVVVSGFLGSVDTPGYNKAGKEYTNKYYSETKYNLDFKIKGAIGTITIEEVEPE